MTSAEYLAFELSATERHQYLAGAVYAMAGGSPRHAVLTANGVIAFGVAVRGSGCRVASNDLKIHIPKTGNFVYPDFSIICGAVELYPGSTHVAMNPRGVVEVLSKSTEAHDRSGKWEDYQSLVSLTDYVLVAQNAARVEHYARQTDGSWRYRAARAGETITLTTGVIVSVDEIYEGAFDVPELPDPE